MMQNFSNSIMMYTRILRTSRRLAPSRTCIRGEINTRSNIDLHCSPIVSATNSFFTADRRFYCSKSKEDQCRISQATFEELCSETLDSLCDHFEDIIEKDTRFRGADVTYSDGVLNVYLGEKIGTYVINRQSPNRQIWLSSPVSGPKRYDLEIRDKVRWINRHEDVTLHDLLQQEMTQISGSSFYIKFTECAHSSS